MRRSSKDNSNLRKQEGPSENSVERKARWGINRTGSSELAVLKHKILEMRDKH